MRFSRRSVFRLALIILGVLAGLALGEIVARVPPRGLVFELRGLHELRPDERWMYGLRPGAEGRPSNTGEPLYVINEDGLRGPRRVRPKPKGVFRLVTSGDSIAFGYGVREEATFPRALERRLWDLSSSPRFEVVNLGVGGYNAWHELELLKGVGLTYEPDLVIVQFCINDLNDPTVHFDARTRLMLETIPDRGFPNPELRRGARIEPSRGVGWCLLSSLCARSLEWLRSESVRVDAEARRAALAPIEATERPEWRWLEARYREMAEAVGPGGPRFALLAFPYRKQLGEVGTDPVQHGLRTIADELDWIFVDPLPAFRRARAGKPGLFLDRWHPSALGHRVAAEVTFHALACEGALGEQARWACPRRGDEQRVGE
jgi:hypothetical protein